MARKSKDAFRTISEVSYWLNTPAHVLRFWEGKFAHIKPIKRAGGRRYYRTRDMELLGGIKILLHVEGLSIKEVQERMKINGPKSIAALSPNVNEVFVTPSPSDPSDQIGETSAPVTAKVIPLPRKEAEFSQDTSSLGGETTMEHAVQTSFIEDTAPQTPSQEAKPTAQAPSKKPKQKSPSDILPGQLSLFEGQAGDTEAAPDLTMEHVAKLMTATSVASEKRQELQALQQKLAQLLERAA